MFWADPCSSLVALLWCLPLLHLPCLQFGCSSVLEVSCMFTLRQLIPDIKVRQQIFPARYAVASASSMLVVSPILPALSTLNSVSVLVCSPQCSGNFLAKLLLIASLTLRKCFGWSLLLGWQLRCYPGVYGLCFCCLLYTYPWRDCIAFACYFPSLSASICFLCESLGSVFVCACC